MILKETKPSKVAIINNEIQEEEEGGEEEIDLNENDIKSVESQSVFYAISDCIQKYYDYISFNINNAEKETNSRNFDAVFAQMENITTKEAQQTAIYNLLDERYIMQKGIKIDNILEKIEINEPLEFYATSIKYLDGKITRTYIVSGKTRLLSDKSYSENVIFIVTVDRNSSTYMIEPVDKKYVNMENIDIEDYQKNIENKDERNVLKYVTYKDKDIAQKYFNYYKNVVFYDKEEIYNLFSEEYKNKRFGNIQNFEKYVDNIIKYDKGISAQQYLVNNYENYKEYVCKDQYGNLYIFKEKNPMEWHRVD